jgi:hypothetical protein
VQPSFLGPVMRAEAAGKEAVAIGHVHNVPGPRTGGAHGPRDDAGPCVDVPGGVADHGGFAGGAGGGVDARDPLPRDGEHAERVVVAQVLLHGEGEFREVGKVTQVVGVDADDIEGVAVMRDVFVGVPQRPAQAVDLKRRDLVAAGGFDRVERCRVGRQVAHHAPSSGKCVPPICREAPRKSATVLPSPPVTVTSVRPERPVSEISVASAMRVSPSRPGLR